MFEDRDLVAMSEDELRKMRGNEVAMVFQDPLSSLHPLYTVGKQLVEAVKAHRDVSKRRRASGRSRCSAMSASPTRAARSTTSRTSSPEACASAR